MVDPRVSAINLLSCQACLHRMVSLSRRGVGSELQDGFAGFFGMKNLGFLTIPKDPWALQCRDSRGPGSQNRHF